MTAAGKRKLRSLESAQRRALRVANKRIRRSKSSGKASKVSIADREEVELEQKRLRRIQETAERNAFSQKRILFLKAEKKKQSSRLRAKRYQRLQGIQRDREAFFAAIDAPLGYICGGCGALAPSLKSTVIDLAENQELLSPLVVEEGTLNSAIINEAVVVHAADNREAKSAPFCDSCYRSLKRRQVPKFSRASGFCIRAIPDELRVLNSMEARLIGLGACFTTCFNLPGDGQECTHGNTINYWNDACSIAKTLPRPIARCGTIRVRTHGESNDQRFFNVRPNLVRSALHWLIQHNPLYEGVEVDEEVLASFSSSDVLEQIPTLEVDAQDLEETRAERENVNDAENGINDNGGACEDTEYAEPLESFCLAGGVNSIQSESQQVMENVRQGGCIDYTKVFELPQTGEPMNEYSSNYLMQYCFPTLFPDGRGGFFALESGESRMHKVDLAEYCSYLMSWHDRRFVMHRTFKFFCLNLIQRRQIDGLVRKVPMHSDSERDELADGSTDSARLLRQLKPFFKGVRGTGLYWATVRDDLMSMIGNDVLATPWPTFFFTLSAADTIWPDFFRVCDPRLTWEEASRLSSKRRRQYLNENPDLACQHFFRRFKAFFDTIICGDARPLGEVCDFFWRVEFQKRGSPHIHGLLWIKDAPNVMELSATDEGRKQLAEYVDRFISAASMSSESLEKCRCELCQSGSRDDVDILASKFLSDPSPAAFKCDIGRLVNRVQEHVCFTGSSCRAKSGRCRFGYPKALKSATEIETSRARNGAISLNIGLRRSSAFTNNYSPELLYVWRANMDIKLIGNAYGAAEYTAAYVSKAEPDSSRFQNAILKALQKCESHSPHHVLLKKVANATLAVRDVSAQEALWILISGMNMYGKSKVIERVKVSRHSSRYYRVDAAQCLNELNGEQFPESEKIRLEPMEKAYIARPHEDRFDQMTYKQFCEYYEISRDAPSPRQQLQRWKRLDGQGYIKERRQPQVLCKSPRMKADPSNPEYCFSEIMLKISWRDLAELPTSDEDCISTFARLSTVDGVIGEALQEDVARSMQLNLLAEAALSCSGLTFAAPQWTLNDELGYEYSGSASTVEVSEETTNTFSSKHHYTSDDIARAETFITKVVKPFVKEAKASQNTSGVYGHRASYQYPVGGQPKALNDDQWVPFAICMGQSRQRYRSLVSGDRCTPMRMIINGEGGTGKSWVIQHIVQDVQTVFGDNARRVLLMAHQGTAAFNIGGETICSALGLGTSQTGGFNRDYVSLASTKSGLQKLRRFQDEYKDVHVIVIDEYSVISCGMLHWIDERLREIFPASDGAVFGGRDVIFVGDPAQLGPVTPSALTTPTEKLTSTPQQKGRQLWQAIDTVCQLTSQNRGENDPEWFSALHRLRDMTVLPQDLKLFNSRNIRKGAWPEWTERAVHIAYKNEDVDRANEECLRRQQEPIVKIEAKHQIMRTKDCGNLPVDADAANRLLEEATEPSYTRDKEIRSILNVAVGAPVTLTVNLAQTAGLCNGTRGVVYDFMFKSGDSVPIVLIEITSKYAGPSFLENVPNIVPIAARTISWGKRNAGMKTRRTGLPLRLAYAMTVHKVQGLTCEWLVFDPSNLPSSTFAYVGLSRVRQRQNIILTSPILLRLTGKLSEANALINAENDRIRRLAHICKQKAELVVQEMKSVATMHNTALSPRY